MRDLTELNQYRYEGPEVNYIWGTELPPRRVARVFYLPTPDGVHTLKVIATTGDGWDHVSVSRPDRIPTWSEMEQVKRAFFKPTETAMQLHVPTKDHISRHDRTLHLWRPTYCEIPRPPASMV